MTLDSGRYLLTEIGRRYLPRYLCMLLQVPSSYESLKREVILDGVNDVLQKYNLFDEF